MNNCTKAWVIATLSSFRQSRHFLTYISTVKTSNIFISKQIQFYCTLAITHDLQRKIIRCAVKLNNECKRMADYPKIFTISLFASCQVARLAVHQQLPTASSHPNLHVSYSSHGPTCRQFWAYWSISFLTLKQARTDLRQTDDHWTTIVMLKAAYSEGRIAIYTVSRQNKLHRFVFSTSLSNRFIRQADTKRNFPSTL